MDINYLDKIAKYNGEMPVTHVYAQAYFIASRHLYRQYEQGLINIEQAREEKEKLKKSFKDADEEIHFVLSVINISEKLRMLRENGFDSSLEWEILAEIDKILR